MKGELVFTTTPDHVRLHGFYCSSDSPLRTNQITGACDAAIVMHGLGGNFYSSRLLSHITQTLVGLGISTVVVNTRGHDMINTSTWGGRARSVGAALETVGDATHDVHGWVSFLEERGHSNVLLSGHSLGAIKSLYAQAYSPHRRVKAIFGLSATRLSYHSLIDSPRGDLFRETIQRCEQLIAAQQGDVPIEVPFPFPTWMTPKLYFEKYGPEETYNWTTFIDKIDIPTLLIFGQRELDENAAFEGLRPELDRLNQNWNSITVEEIEGADHFYASQMGLVDDHVVRWLTC